MKHRPTTPETLLRELLPRIERERGSGFRFSPADWLAAGHVLEGPAGRTCLETGVFSELKYLLAPVLARNEYEQAQAHRACDAYCRELAERQRKHSVRGWHLALLAALLALWAFQVPNLRATYHLFWEKLLEYFVVPDMPPMTCGIAFARDLDPRTGQRSDMLAFINQCQPSDSARANALRPDSTDEANFDYTWFVLHPATRDTLFRQAGRNANWLSDATDRDYKRKILLRGQFRKTNESFWCEDSVVLVCRNPPTAPEISEKELPGGRTQLGTTEPIEPGVTATWSFPDTTWASVKSPTIVRRFPSKQPMNVLLTLSRSPANGLCVTTVAHVVHELAPRPVLPFKPLALDEHRLLGMFRWHYYVVMIFSAALALYFLLWWQVGRGKKGTAEAVYVPVKLETLAPHAPPYHIQFASQDAHLPLAKETQQLAVAIVGREETPRERVDVHASVRATVASGGYPVLRKRLITNPSEYLILLDEHEEDSHQAQLFKHLVGQLPGLEARTELFFYKRDLDLFWNDHHVRALDAGELFGLFPTHRVLVLGDGHGLLDPFPEEQPGAFVPELATVFEQWPQRILLTPRPPAHWDEREETLAERFTIFPADLRGQAQLAQYLANGCHRDELPASFAQWRAEQQQHRGQEADPDASRWGQPQDFEEFFTQNPTLYRWLCALAVYEKPVWEMTLAIGKAIGAEIGFDQLLLLARVPWLRDGTSLDFDLQDALRAQADAAGDERPARNAAITLLTEAQPSTEGSLAFLDKTVSLALQQLALAPQEAKNQQVAHRLDIASLLAPGQQRELKRLSVLTSPTRQGWTSDLSWSLAFAVLTCLETAALILSPSEWLLRTPSFLQTVFIEQKTAYEPWVDANNFAARYFNQDSLAQQQILPNDSLAIHTENWWLRDAIARAPQGRYPLASQNLHWAQWNTAAGEFNLANLPGLRPDSSFTLLSKAFDRFSDVGVRYAELFFDAEHGKGLCSWYMGATNTRDFAREVYQNMNARNSAAAAMFFDTVQVEPNLRDLLGIRPPANSCFRVVTVAPVLTLRTTSLSRRAYAQLEANSNRALDHITFVENIPQGKTVHLLARGGAYFKVEYQGRVGYVPKLLRGRVTLQSCELPVRPIRPIANDPKASPLAQFAQSGEPIAVEDLNFRENQALALEIKEKLQQLGLLDPDFQGDAQTQFGPSGLPDSQVGLNTRNALAEFCRVAGLVYIESRFTPEMAERLLTAEPDKFLPVEFDDKASDDVQTHLAKRILRLMRAKNYWIARGPDMKNIVYVEGLNGDGSLNANNFNEWNDRRIVFEIAKGGKPKMVVNDQATTEPGAYYVQRPLNPNGAAHIAFGQYKAWVDGLHQGKWPALVQRENVRVFRDKNKDGRRSPDDPIDVGKNFGVNQHSTSPSKRPDFVGPWSAGTLTGQDYARHLQFLNTVKKDPRYLKNRGYLFVTTILDGKELSQQK